jgi:hypothetical protein
MHPLRQIACEAHIPTLKRPRDPVCAIMESDTDLTMATNKRVRIENLGNGKFIVSTSFGVRPCDRRYYPYRYLKQTFKRRFGMRPTYLEGNCSSPSGIFFREE